MALGNTNFVFLSELGYYWDFAVISNIKFEVITHKINGLGYHLGVFRLLLRLLSNMTQSIH